MKKPTQNRYFAKVNSSATNLSTFDNVFFSAFNGYSKHGLVVYLGFKFRIQTTFFRKFLLIFLVSSQTNLFRISIILFFGFFFGLSPSCCLLLGFGHNASFFWKQRDFFSKKFTLLFLARKQKVFVFLTSRIFFWGRTSHLTPFSNRLLQNFHLAKVLPIPLPWLCRLPFEL